MEKRTLVLLVVALGFVLSLSFLYFESKDSNVITGEVIKESEPMDTSDLTKQVEEKAVVDYKIIVRDKLTKDPLEDAFVYLDGDFMGKTSEKGWVIVSDLELGKHSIHAEFDEVSEIESVEVSEIESETTLYLVVPKTITIKLSDSETKNPIDRATVFLETTSEKAYLSTRPTTDKGETQIDNVLPATYQLVLEQYPNARPSEMIVVGSKDYLETEVDMPNPKFTGSMICEATHKLLGDNSVSCEVTLKNNEYDGSLTSVDTNVLVVVFSKKSGEDLKMIGHDLLEFGDLSAGSSDSRKTKSFGEYSRFDEETQIIATVYDGWKYTPENYKQIGGNTLSQGLFSELTGSAVNWCAENMNECVSAGEKVVGFIVTVI